MQLNTCWQMRRSRVDGKYWKSDNSMNLKKGTLSGLLKTAGSGWLSGSVVLVQLAEGKTMPIWATLRQVQREGGTRALFTGVGPRAVRAAPACAIVLASYEVLKAMHLS